MAEILCLTCKETVTFGDHCNCFSYGRNGKQYSLPKLDALDQKHAEYIEAKDEYLFTSLDNYSIFYSEFQQIEIKDYKNKESPENENNEEDRLSNDLNRIKKIPALIDKKGITESFQNQSGDSISSLNFMENAVHFNDFPSTKTCEATNKPETEFLCSRKQEQFLTSVFHQQRSSEGDPFSYTDQAPKLECEMMWHKNDFPSFYQREKLHKTISGFTSQETNLKINNYSAQVNSSINTNFWPVGKTLYENVNNQSEVNLTQSLNFSEVSAPSVHENVSLVDKVLESIESMKDSNNDLSPSEGHSDIIPSRNMKPIIKEIYDCDNSEKSSFNQKSLPRINKSDFSKKFSVCDNSQSFIFRKDQLETNQRKHNLEKKFACNICEKRFTSKSKLSTHYRMHIKEKPFVCNKYGKVFPFESHLVNLCLTQIGERPYECDKCRKRFTSKGNLNDHYKTHTNERPFGCDFCEKLFKRRNALVVHRRTHTGEKPFECDLCEKRFNQISHLNSHYRTHSSKNL